MSACIDYQKAAPDLFRKFVEFSMALKKASLLGNTIFDLVHIRASQLNGCAFCLDMHIKEATLHKERPLRLHHVAIWRESPLFDARERAVLEWTEAVTHLDRRGVADETYVSAKNHFTDQELVELTWAVAEINAWNRVNVAFQGVPGSADKAFGLDKAGLE